MKPEDQHNLFSIEVMTVSLETLVDDATEAILRVYMDGHPVMVAYSGGKDSSSVANLVLNAAVKAKANGASPITVFTTSDTLVENPEITMHYQQELSKVRSFAKKHGLNVQTHVCTPAMASTFQYKVLTGRALPSFPGTHTDCSVDLKINSQRRVRNRIMRELGKIVDKEPVTMIGTRFDESTRRSALMKARGDRADVPVRNKDGDLTMTPIALFSTDDVWEYLGSCACGIYESYSDFKETQRIYAHATGTSCAIVADAILEGGSKQRVGKCGARHGCWTCVQAEDKSLANMVAYDERYEYARPLLAFNRYLRATRYDMPRRHWIGRTIRGGYIQIAPDTYHPQEVRNLTRMLMQMDFDEKVAARRAGRPVMFETLSPEMLIAIDAMQSLNGMALPFTVWADLRDIESGKVRYDIPEVQPFPRCEMPEPRFIYVGDDWATGPQAAWSGLRDAYREALVEGSNCARDLVMLKTGEYAMELNRGPELKVESEELYMFLDMYMDEMIERHEASKTNEWGRVTAAYDFYTQIGILTVAWANQEGHDEVARRSNWKAKNGFGIDYRIDELLGKSVSFAEMNADGRKAWRHKATTNSAQVDMGDLLAVA